MEFRGDGETNEMNEMNDNIAIIYHFGNVVSSSVLVRVRGTCDNPLCV